jgi:hypothetical protein
MYDIEADSRRFRSAFTAATDSGSVFSRYRADYPRRRSFRRYSLSSSDVPPPVRPVVDAIGVQTEP